MKLRDLRSLYPKVAVITKELYWTNPVMSVGDCFWYAKPVNEAEVEVVFFKPEKVGKAELLIIPADICSLELPYEPPKEKSLNVDLDAFLQANCA